MNEEDWWHALAWTVTIILVVAVLLILAEQIAKVLP